MPESSASSLQLVLPDLPAARRALLADPPAWPGTERVDTAGLQLVLAAMKQGLVPPPGYLDAAPVAALWQSLGLPGPTTIAAPVSPAAPGTHADPSAAPAAGHGPAAAAPAPQQEQTP